MSEGLAAQISSIVRQHLADAHRMLGAMLARLDAGSEGDLGGRAVSQEATKPAIAALSGNPSTVARRERKRRARLRQADGQAKPPSIENRLDPASSSGWPALRTELDAAIKERRLSRGQVAGQLNVSKGAVLNWLSANGGPPSGANIRNIRDWLAAAPVAATDADPGELFKLSLGEQQLLAGHLSLGGNTHELRSKFGMSPELLSQACAGEHLAADVIARLRGVLANGAAPE